MNCPKCSHRHTDLIGSKHEPERSIHTRRCRKCRHTFETVETYGLGVDILLRSIQASRMANQTKALADELARAAERLTVAG